MKQPAEKSTCEDLTALEIEAINAILDHYEDHTSVAIEALNIVQKHRRWISDSTLRAVADFLHISLAHLESVATFDNLIYRQPVGDTVIHYCTSVTCWMLGSDQIREHLCQRLHVEPGETSADGQYTLLPIVCLGACHRAPAALVGDELKTDLNADVIDEILAR